jgi:hypothetical protein
VSELNKNSDDQADIDVSDKFSDDLKALFEGAGQVPPQRDRAILDAAFEHLSRRRKTRRILRWTVGVSAATVVAAAAVIMIGLVIMPTLDREKELPVSPDTLNSWYFEQAINEDIDGSGRVDILDAFALARQIENKGEKNPAWDINGDGAINQKDVDSVALAAVRLSKGV